MYLNLPNEDIKEAAIASIKGNEAMYTSSDVGKYFNRETGILDPEMYDYNSLMGVDFSHGQENPHPDTPKRFRSCHDINCR